jgi:4-hydroxy-tetrahydrodipicolinate synthase
MSQPSFHGIFPYLVSPVDEASGQVQTETLRRLVEHLIGAGVHGLSPLGSTGEFAYLDADQRRAIVQTVVQAAGGRVPVVPGVAATATADAIRQAQDYLALGADGIILILQSYFPLPRSAVERYFQEVAEAVPCPVVIYTNPNYLGVDVTPEMVASLAQVPNIQYVKDASSNTGRILTILNKTGGRIHVFSASAHVPVLVFLLGGVGWMAGPACLIPRQCVELYHLAQAQRWQEAMALQKPMWRLNELFARYSLAGCVKAGLALQGFDVGVPIAPQEPVSAQAMAEIRDVLESLDALAPAPA